MAKVIVELTEKELRKDYADYKHHTAVFKDSDVNTTLADWKKKVSRITIEKILSDKDYIKSFSIDDIVSLNLADSKENPIKYSVEIRVAKK